MTPLMRVVSGAIMAAAGVSAMASLVARAPQSTSVFRAGVDLIQLDVQAVDKSGRPVADLSSSDFRVSFNGHPRDVVSADFVRYGTTTGGDRASVELPGANAAVVSGRFVMLAVDALTFDVGGSRNVAAAAQAFVNRLQPNDAVGLYTFPLGPKVEPTTDHASVTAALGHVVGQRTSEGSKLRPSEIVDITAGDPLATAQAVERVCGVRRPLSTGRLTAAPPPTDCESQLINEATEKALEAEARTTVSLGMLGTFLRKLGEVPGRKVVVLVSAGTPVADRPGGRPDVGSLPTELGRQAAQSNATIYTLYIDQGLLNQNAAENQHGFGGMSNQARDSAVLSHWLDLFSGSAGGVLLTDMVGGGEVVFDRILSETSAYYLLGVEPKDADRDGRAHELKVKVDRKGVTVRSRGWAVVPKR